MKNLILFTLLLLLFATPSWGLVSDQDRASLTTEEQILTNPGFEAGSAGWTASGGTFSINTATPLFGKRSGSWDSNADEQTLQTGLLNIPTGFVNSRCQAIIKHTYPSGDDGDYKLVVRQYDDSAATEITVDEVDLSVTTAVGQGQVFFTCPDDVDDTLRLRIESTVADAGAITIDSAFLGVGKFSLLGGVERYEEITLTDSGDQNIDATIYVGRTGNNVTIYGTATHDNNIGPVSDTGVIPAWARPVVTSQNNYFTQGSDNRNVNVSPSGVLTLAYGSARTSSAVFSLSYSVPSTNQIMDTNTLGLEASQFLGSIDSADAITPTIAKLTFDEIFDPTSAYASGTFTAQKSGLYEINGYLLTDTESWVNGDLVGVRAYVDGSPDAWLARRTFQTTTSNRADVPFKGTVYLNANQTLEIWASSEVSTNLVNDPFWNRLSITRKENLTVLGAVSDQQVLQKKIGHDGPATTKLCMARIGMGSGTPVLSVGFEDQYNCIDSLSDSGVGDTVVNFRANFFTGPVICSHTTNNGGANGVNTINGASDATSVNFRTYNTSGVLTDANFEFICIGN